MEYSPTESKDGLYDIYYTTAGERLVVLEGLNPQDQIAQYPIQSFMHEHYDAFSLFYWLLYVTVLLFVFTKFVGVPLFKKWRQERVRTVTNTSS